MKRRLIAGLIAVLVTLLTASPAAAINYGQPDENDHPYVGILLFETAEGTFVCSGSLIAPTIFLTAAHCTYGATSAWVSFDFMPDFDAFPAGWISGTAHANPLYPGDLFVPNSHDVGVVILDEPVHLSRYGQLPELNFLDRLATRRGMQEVTFTDVGYGLQSRKPRFEWTPMRLQATSSLVSLRSHLTDGYNLQTSNNPGNDRGGNCSGDSGGPVLYGNSDTIVAVDSFTISPTCKGVDYNFRVDTQESLDFINQFR